MHAKNSQIHKFTDSYHARSSPWPCPASKVAERRWLHRARTMSEPEPEPEPERRRPPPRRQPAGAPPGSGMQAALAAIASGAAAGSLRPVAARPGAPAVDVDVVAPVLLDFDSEVRARLTQRSSSSAGQSGRAALAAEAAAIAALQSQASGWRDLPPAQIRELGAATVGLRGRLVAAGIADAEHDDSVWCGGGGGAAELGACCALLGSVRVLEDATEQLRRMGGEAGRTPGTGAADAGGLGSTFACTWGTEPGRLESAVARAAQAATEAALASRRGMLQPAGKPPARAPAAAAAKTVKRGTGPPPPPPPPLAGQHPTTSWRDRPPVVVASSGDARLACVQTLSNARYQTCIALALNAQHT